MNKVILMGRLTRDPEVRYTQSAAPMAVVRYGLAVNKRFKRQGDSAEADFFNCTAFGRQAEFVEKSVPRGDVIIAFESLPGDRAGSAVFVEVIRRLRSDALIIADKTHCVELLSKLV